MAEPTPDRGRARRRTAVQGTLAVLVSLGALWWAFQDAELGRMSDTLRRSNLWVVAAYTVGLLGLHLLRVLRWGMHIRAISPTVSVRVLGAAANVGIPATFFLPLRLGEFVRPMMLHRSGVHFGSSVASIVVERVADGLCSVGMFFVFFSFVPETSPVPEELTRLSSVATAGFLGALAFLVAAALAREPVLGLTRLLLGRVSRTLADRVVGLVGTFLDGLAALGSAWRAALYIGLTAAFWLGNGLITWWLAASYEPSLPVSSGLFTISILVFAVMIPAGPAFAGTFEVGFKLGFGAFGLDATSAIVVAVVAHILQIATMALLLGLGLGAAESRLRARSSFEVPEPAAEGAPPPLG